MANGSKHHRRLIRKAPRGICRLPLICASSFLSFLYLFYIYIFYLFFLKRRGANEIHERLKPVKGHDQHLSNPIHSPVFVTSRRTRILLFSYRD